MATKLKKMRLTSVDLVRAGANQEADICLYKSADPTEPPEQPTAEEKNIFKRFINWLRENPTEADSEPTGPIEKAGEQPDRETIYKNAITESLQSIIADDSLSATEKSSMIEKSIEQYHEAMMEFFKGYEPEEDPEDLGYLLEGIEKSDRYDEIEEI